MCGGNRGVEELKKKSLKDGGSDDVLKRLKNQVAESEKMAGEALQLCEKLVEKPFSMAIRQVLYRNPEVDFNLHGINPYHEFHGGKLFVMVGEDRRGLDDILYELWLIPRSVLGPFIKYQHTDVVALNYARYQSWMTDGPYCP
ncbi:hypothetical protein RJT34_13838 [Clitoria ternatea]|uniref:Uncharacterized protein n=1 Tax=Clitoria ternatea TaxID=43366 RepID=A0AAN9JRT7_CLITE